LKFDNASAKDCPIRPPPTITTSNFSINPNLQ
jgi:hypothetical protein